MSYQVGDSVYGSFGRHGGIDVKQGVVVKVTPTGMANVDFGETHRGNGTPLIRKFKVNGFEHGGDRFHAAFLVDLETYERLKVSQNRQQALSQLNAHLRSAWIKDRESFDKFMATLEPLVAKAGELL